MLLNLTDSEARFLREIIAARRDTLVSEIDHADVRAARDELKARFDDLMRILAKLESEQVGRDVYA